MTVCVCMCDVTSAIDGYSALYVTSRWSLLMLLLKSFLSLLMCVYVYVRTPVLDCQLLTIYYVLNLAV